MIINIIGCTINLIKNTYDVPNVTDVTCERTYTSVVSNHTCSKTDVSK